MPSNAVAAVVEAVDPRVRTILQGVESTLEAQSLELLEALNLTHPPAIRTRLTEEIRELRAGVVRVRSIVRAIGGGL